MHMKKIAIKIGFLTTIIALSLTIQSFSSRAKTITHETMVVEGINFDPFALIMLPTKAYVLQAPDSTTTMPQKK